MSFKIATCQFPVGPDIAANAAAIRGQLAAAAAGGARVAHFCEGALSGYAGVDMPDHSGLDWAALRAAAEGVMAAAAARGLWVVLGSSHPLTPPHKPHNSLYIIDDTGALVDRYDKRFCAGPCDGEDGDLAHYTPGRHPVVFEVDGVRCGAMICHEYRYPELYRDYQKRGVRVMFHSYHAANADPARVAALAAAVGEPNCARSGGRSLPEITMPATMISYAANNYMWISASNSSAPESLWPAFAVRPDGVMVGRLARNEAGVLITEIDPTREYYDSTRDWRGRAMRGQFHSGELVEDPRSADRRSL